MKVVVVGGGISGLATAHAAAARHDVTVLEAGDVLGGNIRTSRRDGFLIDDGPDSWVSNKPHATALARALGLGDRLIETVPRNRRVYVREHDRLVPLPEGLVLGIPTRVLPLVRTPLLSWRGKARAALDLVLPAGFGRVAGEGGDESLERFLERRVGREVVERLAGPLLGGLFSGDVSALSLRATFPQLASLEEKGGLIRGARSMAPRRAAGQAPPSAFTSLRGGVGELIDALATQLGDVVRRRARVHAIEREGSGWSVRVDGERLSADHVVLTGPAHVAASLLRSIDAPLADMLADIPYGSAATAFVAHRRADVPHALDATGYLVPSPSQRHGAVASTFVSSKWEERAPSDRVLMRVFFAGDDAEGLGDDALIERARAELRETVGVTAEPLFTHVARFVRSSPQPRVGHPARMQRVAARLDTPTCRGIHLVGSAYDGVGIGDCIRRAQQVAALFDFPASTR